MADPHVDQRLVAILAADVAGYSRLMEADERATVATLYAYRVVFQESVTAHGGRIVDTAGDSVLAVFPTAIGGVEAAITIQDELRDLNEKLPEDRRMRFRLGVNLGDVIEKDDGSIYGSGVNVAARLESLAEPGGICLSGSAHEQVDGKTDCGFEYIGEHEVKNIARPVRVFRLKDTKAPVSASGETLALPDKPSIAVPTFDNLSGDTGQKYFADSIAEDSTLAVPDTEHILVVDDDPDTREELEQYLTGKGFRVTTADGGAAMREVLKRDPADLIILDLRMPGEDGFALTSSIRKTSDAGIIILTGTGDEVDHVVGLELGADDFVSKPADLRQLLARVRSVLRRVGHH